MALAAVASPALLNAQATTRDMASLDSLLNTTVRTVSKYSSLASSAPASVTIVSSEQIRLHGYRHMGELLETVRGMYISNDRNYTYLGTRGFGLPSDYNNRILLLLDGHTLNEQIWGGSPIGMELPINLNAVERVEIVHGPGSVLYGSSAVFAVINIITKPGSQVAGTHASLSTGINGSREGTFLLGSSLGPRSSLSVSGVATRSSGADFHFTDLAETPPDNGYAIGMDWERAAGGLATLTVGDIDLRVGHRTRDKGIPTGAFETLLSDPRASTHDESSWAEISARREQHGSYSIMARLYVDRYRYHGTYPSGPGPAYNDRAVTASSGGELVVTWDPTSRVRLTTGTEFRDVRSARYEESSVSGAVYADNAPFRAASFYGQGEYSLSSATTLTAGLRHDNRSGDRDAFAPRLALVTRPDASTTLKLLYGWAYREPSVAEADLGTTYYSENRTLRSEQLESIELVIHRRLRQSLLAELSAYRYRITDLIEQVTDGAGGGAQFQNISAATANGVSLELNWMPGELASANLSYALQKVMRSDGAGPMANSPGSIVNLRLASRPLAHIESALSLRYESQRLTLRESSTRAFFRADANVIWSLRGLAAGSLLDGADLSFKVSNLFDTYYAIPGGVEHRQTSIPQDGRSLSVRLGWQF